MFYHMQMGSVRSSADSAEQLEGCLSMVRNVEDVVVTAFHTEDDRDSFEREYTRKRDAAIERQASGYNDSY